MTSVSHHNQHTAPPPETRFWENVDKTADGCWLWLGGKNHNGYGAMFFAGRTIGAHRFAYQLLVGPVPHGFHLHHECQVRACVNPAHLVAVSPHEHPVLHAASVTHCKNGHELTPENTRLDNSKTGGAFRSCRVCDRDRKRRIYIPKEGRGPNGLKTHCKHGHEFTEENTRKAGGERKCRACSRDAQLRYLARLSATRSAP